MYDIICFNQNHIIYNVYLIYYQMIYNMKIKLTKITYVKLSSLKPFSRWSNGKSLELKSLFSLLSQVRAQWLLI